jgi:hypothetical protein
MSETVSKRRALGNGHKAWLKMLSPPWHFVKDIGEAWDHVRKDPSSTMLIDYVAKKMRVELRLQNNQQVCGDLKNYFTSNGIEPLDLPESGPWMWMTHYIGALYVARSCLRKEDINDNEIQRSKAAGVTTANCLYSHFNTWLSGNQTFVFSLPLASKLLLTDATHIQWKDFHCTFRAFVIQLPPDLADLIDPHTGHHPLDSIIVVDGTANGKRRLQILFKGQENEKSKCIGDDSTIFCNVWENDKEDDLESAIAHTFRNVDDKYSQAAVAGKSGDEAILQLMRFTVACIVYLTDLPEDRVVYVNPEINRLETKIPSLSGKPKQNAKAKLRSLLKEPASYLVGTKVTIDPMLQRVAGAVGKGQHLPPSVASYVRGHRRMQPCGPQNSLRKPVWIDPYWRNLDNEVSTSKTYEVK